MGSGFVRFSISTGIYIISGTDRNDFFLCIYADGSTDGSFCKNTLKFEKYKVLDVINLLFYANALIQGILNKCLKFHMVHMLFVTHVLLFIAVMTIVVLMIEEYRRTKDSELKIIMNAFGIMAVAGYYHYACTGNLRFLLWNHF